MIKPIFFRSIPFDYENQQDKEIKLHSLAQSVSAVFYHNTGNSFITYLSDFYRRCRSIPRDFSSLLKADYLRGIEFDVLIMTFTHHVYVVLYLNEGPH